MNIAQIAKTIDQKNWGFTVYKSKPEFKELVKHAYQVGDTANYIMQLAKENQAEEIQIIPSKKNGSTFTYGVQKIVTINFKKDNKMDGEQYNMIAGLGNIGIDPVTVFTAKDKAAENAELKNKITQLEKEVKTLEKEKGNLERKAEIDEFKNSQKSELMELLKSPQAMSLATALISRVSAPALTGAAPQIEAPQIDGTTKFIVDHLTAPNTDSSTGVLIANIVKADKMKRPQVLKDIAKVLIDHKIIVIPEQVQATENI